MEMERAVADLVERLERRFYGKYRGIVEDNADPERLGRLRLRVPSLLGAELVTGWALACVPYGGASGQGQLFIPDRGAGVWVEFEEGDLEFPVWVGTFWSKPQGDSELPRPNDPDGTAQSQAQDPPTRKIIKTKKGHTLQFEDKDDEELVLLHEASNRHVIRMDKDGITISDGTNGHEVTMTASGMTLTDGANSGNTVVMEGGGVSIQDKNGHKVVLGAGGVQIGSDGATEPFVLGTQFLTKVASFLTALSTHTHVGNMGAPTSPPTAPINLDVPLSTKHRTE